MTKTRSQNLMRIENRLSVQTYDVCQSSVLKTFIGTYIQILIRSDLLKSLTVCFGNEAHFRFLFVTGSKLPFFWLLLWALFR